MRHKLHPINESWLKAFKKHPVHAVVVQLNHNIEHDAVIAIVAEALDASNAIHTNTEEALSIEHVRELKKLAQLRKSESERHLFALDMRQGVSVPAQNSLLKILEEPPKQTFFVILTTNSSAILPTIHSRARLLRILPLSGDEFSSTLTSNFPSIEPDELRAHAVAFNYSFAATTMEPKPVFDEIRTFLSLRQGERLAFAKTLKEREAAIKFVENLLLLASQTQLHTAKISKKDATTTWLNVTKRSLNVLSSLSHNGNVSLQMNYLALTLPTMR